jgi:hypothetical protein
MTDLDSLEEDWVHKPTPVKAVRFTGFGPDGNGDLVLAWLRSYNVDADPVPGDKIVFDNGTDDLPIQAVLDDTFIRDPEDDNIHRVKAHRWADLYERPSR